MFETLVKNLCLLFAQFDLAGALFLFGLELAHGDLKINLFFLIGGHCYVVGCKFLVSLGRFWLGRGIVIAFSRFFVRSIFRLILFRFRYVPFRLHRGNGFLGRRQFCSDIRFIKSHSDQHVSVVG